MIKQHDIDKEASYCCYNMVIHMLNLTFSDKYASWPIETRIKFSNSKLLKLFCDCSMNFEYHTLYKIINKHLNNPS